MKKRIKKKKATDAFHMKFMKYMGASQIADRYENMAANTYLPYNNIPESSKFRYNDRLCHYIFVNNSKYFILSRGGDF